MLIDSTMSSTMFSIMPSVPGPTITYTAMGNLLYPDADPLGGKHGIRYPLSDPPESQLNGFHDAEEVVSVIHQGQTGPPTVTNHILDDNTRHTQTLPGATGYTFLGSTTSLSVDDKRLEKLLRKSVSSVEKLYHLFRGVKKNTALHCTQTSQDSSFGESPEVTIGESAFISRPPLSDGSDMTEIYTKIRFQYRNGLTATQYFQSRCSTIKSVPPLERFKHIDINTGICMFSEPTLSTPPGHHHSSTNDGTFVIPALPWNVNLTMYELEIITRLSSSIADTVGLIGNRHTSCETLININIDIPDLQYYWTACELLRKNLVTIGYAQNWIAAIDKRRSQLEAIMTSLIRMFLTDRHLDDVNINITSGTASAALLVKEKIAIGEIPSLEEILSSLRSLGQDAPLWREFFEHPDSRYRPSTVEDLSRLTYVFKAVKPALLDHHLPCVNSDIRDAPGQRIIIQVDDINEWRILDQAKTFLKKYSMQRYKSSEEPIIVGLFPMQRIFAAGPGRSNLYFKDPGSRLWLGSRKRVVIPLDIIGATYGLYIKEQLRLSCLQAGIR